MTCPQCGRDESRVYDSRSAIDFMGELSIRRRRCCESCSFRWATHEINGSHYAAIEAVARAIVAARSQLDDLAATLPALPIFENSSGALDVLRRKVRRSV